MSGLYECFDHASPSVCTGTETTSQIMNQRQIKMKGKILTCIFLTNNLSFYDLLFAEPVSPPFLLTCSDTFKIGLVLYKNYFFGKESQLVLTLKHLPKTKP